MSCCCCDSTSLKLYGIPSADGRGREVVKSLVARAPSGLKGGNELVKVEGWVKPCELVTAPLSQKTCVCYLVEVEWTAGALYHGGDMTLAGGVGGAAPAATTPAWHTEGRVCEAADFGLTDETGACYVEASQRLFPYGGLTSGQKTVYEYGGKNGKEDIEPRVLDWLKSNNVTVTMPDTSSMIFSSLLAGGLGLTGDNALRLTEYVVVPAARAAVVGVAAADGLVSAAHADVVVPTAPAKHLPAFWKAFVGMVGPRLIVATDPKLLSQSPAVRDATSETDSLLQRPATAVPSARFFLNTFDNKAKP